MPLAVNWYDNEQSIIVVTITTDTTWDQYHKAIDWIVSEAKGVDHRVDIIFHDEVGMPKGNPLPHLRTGSTRIIQQSNIRTSIIAGSRGYSGFTRAILETLARSFSRVIPKGTTQNGLLFMRTLDEAVAYIQKDRLKTEQMTNQQV